MCYAPVVRYIDKRTGRPRRATNRTARPTKVSLQHLGRASRIVEQGLED